MPYKDPLKQKEFLARWYLVNKELLRPIRKLQKLNHYFRHRQKLLNNKKQYYIQNKSVLDLKHRDYGRKRKLQDPWIYSYFGAKQRCENHKNKSYKNYGKKGVKFLLTQDQCKILWNRDKGWLLQRPSIDRIKATGNYSFKNSRFIELKKNCQRAIIRRTRLFKTFVPKERR